MRTQQLQKPNVLFICLDQMRGDFMGCNGHPLIMTPHMDQIANEGINFQSAFSECPVCVPARRIMMTGLSSYSIKMNRNAESQPFPEGPKFAELMTKAGYQTFASGKLHTCPPRNRIGFEEVQLNEEGRRVDGLDDYERFLDDNGQGHLAYTHGMGNNQYGMRFSPLETKYTTTQWTADEAMKFIERRDPTRPFFLHVSFDKPHPPITPAFEYYELYKDCVMPEPVHAEWEKSKLPSQTRYQMLKNNWDFWKTHTLNTQQTLKGYAALVTHVDSMIGVLTGTLRERKLLENTIIIITSDHGDALYDHDHTAKVNFFRGPAGIPYIIRPSTEWIKLNEFRQGQKNDTTPANLKDIMPTVLEMCGVEIPETVEGQSLVGTMLREAGGFRKISFGNSHTIYTANDGRYKYIWYSDDNYEYLFDMHNDKADCNDLVENEEYSAVKETLKKALAKWMAENRDERSDGERLIQKEHDWQLDRAAFKTSWNNRGRH